MRKILSDTGLDPKYWLEHFKDIGATTPAALKLLGPEHFDELSKLSEKPVEIVALKNFLGVAKVSLNYMNRVCIYSMIALYNYTQFNFTLVTTHTIGHNIFTFLLTSIHCKQAVASNNYVTH